jgi:hypothetical protein
MQEVLISVWYVYVWVIWMCGSEDAAAEALRQELEIIKEHARQQATREDAVSLICIYIS